MSAATGLVFFVVANFSSFLVGLNIVSSLIQIMLNVLVFVTWLRGYRVARGRERVVALSGVIAPPILAGVTLYRIIIPFFTSLG